MGGVTYFGKCHKCFKYILHKNGFMPSNQLVQAIPTVFYSFPSYLQPRIWKSFDFGPEPKSNSKLEEQNEPSYGNKERTSGHETTKCFKFYNELIPKSVNDLAVHPKKIKEIEAWLILNVLNQERKYPFLLLSGPSGSAKTTTLNVLCKKMSISVSEWINPTDREFEVFKGTSQINRFMEFLTESKWNSLLEFDNDKRVIIVKDFPNVFIHQPEEFSNVLNECCTLRHPIIFICTNTGCNSIDLTRTLFTEDVMNKYNISQISFNACAPSLMKKAIKRAQAIMQEHCDLNKQPLLSVVDAILASSLGDIRNAMNQFYLESLPGSKNFSSIGCHKSDNKRKRNCDPASVRSMSRDENLGLFHGLGRVLNPKRKQLNNSWRLNYDVEGIVEEFLIQPNLFIAFLFENYLKYFGNINDASNAVESLSFSLKFLENKVDKQDTSVFGIWITILGFMIYNEHKVSKWTQIVGPTKINKLLNRRNEFGRLDPMDSYYHNIIKSKNISHTFGNVV